MSTLDLLILIVGATVSLVSIGSTGVTGPSNPSSPPPHAVNNHAAVHNQIVLIVVEAIGAIAVIVFTLAGTTVGVATGHIDPTVIHAVVKTFLTALLVLSTNLLDLLEFVLDSIAVIEFGLLVIVDVLYVLKLLLV